MTRTTRKSIAPTSSSEPGGVRTFQIVHREPRLPRIETARLVLREIGLEDVSQAYIDWLNDPELNKYLEVRFARQTPEAVRAFVEARLADTADTKHFGIYDENGTRHVGTVTAHLNNHHKSADVSFVIGHPGGQAKGYATEAVHALVYYLTRHCDVAMVWAGYYDGHIASGNVLRKIGFVEQGRLRKQLINHRNERVDHVFVGLVAEDFRPDERYLGGLPPEVLEPGS